ncbi:MAG: tRNA (adenosine(37)-N6)-threonylcarbamoyltransferase complex ATPase subunit type 1 TsaE [Candidatus Longimicrobiales bacterium M2_2A_002]
MSHVSEIEITASAVLTEPALEGWGRRVGEAAAGGAIPVPLFVALRGPLGAGKSVLARAVARGAGVTSSMPSPTYNLLFSYDGEGVRVHHLDLYRLEDPDDVWELGWQELGGDGQVVLVEWPERAETLLPPDRWEVTLSFPGDDAAATTLRRIEVRRLGRAPEVPALPESPGGAGEAGESDRAGVAG